MLIAGPNLTIDRTIGVERFDAGHIHRADRVDARIGGGGANAAHTVRRLGAEARLVTMVSDGDARSVGGTLVGQGVDAEWVPRTGPVRIATILRESEGRMTVLNESGPPVAAREWEAFTRLAGSRLRPGETLLCSGSLPPGAPAQGYAYLAQQARHAGSRCVVDVQGEALAATLADREGLLVPNLAEAENLLHGPRAEAVHAEDAPDRAQDVANQLLRRGAPSVVVTAGAAGAAYAEQGPRGRRGWVGAPRVEATNPIGAGDAFAAALGLGLEDGAPLDQAIEFAVAVAAAHVESQRGDLEPGRVAELRSVQASRRPCTPSTKGAPARLAHAEEAPCSGGSR